MARLHTTLPLVLLAQPLAATDFNAGWTGAIDQQWTNFSNWDILKVPNNAGGDTFSAIIGGGAGTVFMNGNVTVEDVALQAGAKISISDGFQFTFRNSLTNDGIITPEGNLTASRIAISDSSGDGVVALTGTGQIVLDHPSDRIGGSYSHTLSLEGGHSIRGHGNVGEGSIRILNASTILADSPGNTLVIQPYVSLTNTGFLRADAGGILRLQPATYHIDSRELRIGDASTIELAAVTLNGGPIEITDTNGLPSDNKLIIPGNSTLNSTRNEAAISVNDAITLTVGGDDFTNNARIDLLSASGASSLSFAGGPDGAISLKGNGLVFLDHLNDTVTGSYSHTLTVESPHLIEGGGNLCAGALRMINQSTITANNSSVPLVISPYVSWFNDGGTLISTGTATTRLNAATYTSANGGYFLIGDNSTIELNSATIVDSLFAIENLDADPLNHHLRIIGNSVFQECTSDAVIRVSDGKVLTLRNNTFENRSQVHLDGATGSTALSFSGGGDAEMTLQGSGTVFLDNAFDQISGSFSHTLRHAASHRIEGGGKLGLGSVNLINHGSIEANLPALGLEINPYITFQNDGGTVVASNGATIAFLTGTYSAPNGGIYEIGDNCQFLLGGGTWNNMTFDIKDTDMSLGNNDLKIVANTTFNGVTNEADLSVDDARTLTLSSGDFTNNTTITLNGSTGASALTFSGVGDGVISLLGTGTVYLDNDLDRINGSFSHRLIQGLDHSIEGSGKIGIGTVNITNHGRIEANRPGENLDIDPYGDFLNDGGTLHATNDGTIRLFSGTYSSSNAGDYRIFDGSQIELHGLTLTNMTLAAEDSNSILADNLALVVENCTMSNVVLETRTEVAAGKTLTFNPGDLINNGDLILDGNASENTTLSGIGTGDGITRLEGTGRLLLDHVNDRLGGAFSHTLVNGPDHRIEGAGSFGLGQVRLLNEGVLFANLNGQTMQIDCYSNDPLDNRGVLHATGGCTINIADPLTDTGGTIAADISSSILINGNATKSGGSLLVNGLFDPSGNTTLSSSWLKGSGLLDSPLTATFTSITPGNSTGTLTIGGNTTLSTGSSLQIEINSASDHDQLVISGGNLQLSGGTLRLDYAGGPTDILSTDVLTISTTTGTVLNQFINIANGARLQTYDGNASFIVNYLPGAITLSDFIYNSPPGPNLSPIFTSFVEDLSIDENTPPGTLLATFSAYDPEGAIIEYSLGGLSSAFEIDPSNGELRVAGPLNHEVLTSHFFTVRAFDNVNYSDVLLTINLNDLVDTNEEITISLLTGPSGPFQGETDPAIIGYDADPDFDGRANIFELWQGTDPSVTDLPVPIILEAYVPANEEFGSAIIEVGSAVDNLLAIDVEFSFDLDSWRNATGNRIVISDSGGIRTLRFFDTAPLIPESRFFIRFIAEQNSER